MALIVPIQAVPSQQVFVVLNGQNCQINIYQKGNDVYFDLNSNGSDVCVATIALNATALDACNSYDGFEGNLFFVDTQGADDPQYVGFGTRWLLYYLTPDEIAALNQTSSNTPVPQIQVYSLAATLTYEATAPGNFSIPHGLGVAPVLIDIVNTVPNDGSPGLIWAQAGFADINNINLVASYTHASATIYVYTLAGVNIDYENPTQVLEVISPSAGNFTVPHGLGVDPVLVVIQPTSNGLILGQYGTFHDASNLYLFASTLGLTVEIALYAPQDGGGLNFQAPAVTLSVISVNPGPFLLAHNLSVTPSRAVVLMTSGGLIWTIAPEVDANYVYLEASAKGLVAQVSIYL